MSTTETREHILHFPVFKVITFRFINMCQGLRFYDHLYKLTSIAMLWML